MFSVATKARFPAWHSHPKRYVSHAHYLQLQLQLLVDWLVLLYVLLTDRPTQPIMASGSWDKAVRIWQLYATKDASEVLEHQSEVLAVAFRPDGKELCSATMDGQLNFWDVESSEINCVIEGRKDVAGGRLQGQRTTAASSTSTKYFSSYVVATVVAQSRTSELLIVLRNSNNNALTHARL
jgi:WD40 repeat protein